MTNIEYWQSQASFIVKPSSFDEAIYQVEFCRHSSKKFITREELVYELNLEYKKVIVLNKKGDKIQYRNFITMAEAIG